MLRTEERESVRKSFLTIWIIWASMFGSLAIYVLICLMLGDKIKSGVSPDVPVQLIKNILAVVSAAEIVIAYVIRRLMLTARKSPGTSQVAGRYSAAVLISLAISESIGIYGFILFLLGEGFPMPYIFIAISATAMIFYRPKTDEFEQFSSYLNNEKNAKGKDNDDF